MDDLFRTTRKNVSYVSNKFRTKTVDFTFVSNDNQQEVHQLDNEESFSEKRLLARGRLWVDYLLQRALEHIWQDEGLQAEDRVLGITIDGGDLTYPISLAFHAIIHHNINIVL